PTPPQTPLTPLRGRLYTYQLVKRKILGSNKDESDLLIDLGFGFFRNIESRQAANFSEGAIVESRPAEDAYKFYSGKRTIKDLYTYQARVEKVIDGDTLKVRLDLGFDSWSRQVLRLRGIDCPEINTAAGEKAKALVQSLLKETDWIIVRSSRSDKYDRYLADIFIGEIYLNNLLLENNLARRMAQ
ncbi:MAG: thermonuclease family protein, partial [Candidatus Omnitrophota bacterium]